MTTKKAPAVSNVYAGTTTFAQADWRNYLMIFAGCDLTVSFGDGDGVIPIKTGGFFEPRVVPTSEFTVVTSDPSGPFVLLSDTHETA